MAVFTIAGLTLKEAVRRRTLLGALALGMLALGLSLLLLLIHHRMQHLVETGRWSPFRMALEYPAAQSLITRLCLSSIKALSAIFAVLLAGGAISGEIERGVMAVVLAKPIYRWQILLGKWIGINLIAMTATFLWTAMVWASLTLQTHEDLTPLLRAGGYLTLYPLLVATLTLTFSTFSQRTLGASIALTLCAFSWFDGIFNAIAQNFDVSTVRTIANTAALAVPQGTVGWWVDGVVEDLLVTPRRGNVNWNSPRLLTEWGGAHLHFPRLDALYVACYILAWLIAGMVIFERRDAV